MPLSDIAFSIETEIVFFATPTRISMKRYDDDADFQRHSLCR